MVSLDYLNLSALLQCCFSLKVQQLQCRVHIAAFFEKKVSALCKTLNMRTDEKCIIFGCSRDLQHRSAIVLIV